MKTHLLAGALLAAAVTTTALAQPYYPGDYRGGYAPYAQPPVQAVQPGPALILEQGLERLIAFAGQEPRPDRAALARFLDREIAPYFDFAYMARWAAGRMWPRMTPQQRREFEGRLQELFLGALAQRLAGYGGQRFRVLRPRAGRDNEVTVGVAVQDPGRYPARLDFRFYRSPEGWKVFDVSANGNSALMYYRQYFRQQMRRRTQPPAYYGRR